MVKDASGSNTEWGNKRITELSSTPSLSEKGTREGEMGAIEVSFESKPFDRQGSKGLWVTLHI